MTGEAHSKKYRKRYRDSHPNQKPLPSFSQRPYPIKLDFLEASLASPPSYHRSQDMQKINAPDARRLCHSELRSGVRLSWTVPRLNSHQM